MGHPVASQIPPVFSVKFLQIKALAVFCTWNSAKFFFSFDLLRNLFLLEGVL